MRLLGVGAQYGVLLPFSRRHESEADLVGLQIMASAGFDPRASTRLWLNMSRSGDDQPPEFLSTHPSLGSRISDLEQAIPAALQVAGNCTRTRTAPRLPALMSCRHSRTDLAISLAGTATVISARDYAMRRPR
jgi:predicted Zn-dependent protease